MKTNEHAHEVLRLRHYAGLLAMLALVSAELWMLCRFGHGYGQISAQPPVSVPAISDLFAAM